MAESKETEPDNVIALSRYRAQLGRGKKLRRADALFAAPNPEAAIRALPGDELFYVVHESPRDALEILVHATAPQVRTVMDFALWERDEVAPARLAEWLEVLAEAPPEKIGEWFAGLDVELVAFLLLRTSTIYDLSEGEPPEEPEGTFYPTPDRLFVLDVRGLPEVETDGGGQGHGEDGQPPDSARAMIRIVDNLYRADRALARRILVGARAELPSTLEEAAFRWRAGRMADLGFADPWEALEVYREIDPATVKVGEEPEVATRLRPVTSDGGGDSLRAPRALVDRLGGSSPFARAVSRLTSPDDIAELHFALVALGNRVLAADRVSPGDDDAVAAVLDRLHATLDIAVEFLARGDDERAVAAVRSVPLMRLFRLGVSVIGKVRRLALALERRGPFGTSAPRLFEHDDAAVVESVTRLRPLYPRLLDEPPRNGERPFASIADVARATEALRTAAAAQALLFALGVRPEHLTPATLEGTTGADAAALDAGVLARTALVARLLAAGGSSAAGDPPTSSAPPFRPLTPDEIRAFGAPAPVPGRKEPAMRPGEKIKEKAKAIIEALTPPGLGEAAAKVAERWIAGLVPLEPVLVRQPTRPGAPRRKR
jgi:hypothetical protein